MALKEKRFVITGGKGFHIQFDNGWTASVQWGPGSYGDNHCNSDFSSGRCDWDSDTAECAAWDKDSNWHDFGGDQVEGYQTPAQILVFLNEIAAKPK
jgi:hypothetical protein